MANHAQSSDSLLAAAQARVAGIGQQLRKQEAPLEDMVLLAEKMLSELKTSDLSPRQYYELNLRCTEELRYLQTWIIDLEKKGKIKLVDLYQRVQYSSSVVPRLYLMLTVGAAYCSLSGAQAREVMRDMLEMCKCVQHPMRGLFLRHYLANITKDKLPILAPPERGEFLLQNFSEMTRLWVRMQPPKKRVVDEEEDPNEAKRKQELANKREIERRQLCQLIGQNLQCISDSLSSFQVFETIALPRVLDIIASSGDGFVQTYLADVLCQVSPNSFQIRTLEKYLGTICGPDMVPGMNLVQVLSTQMERLGDELIVRQNGELKADSGEIDDDGSLDPSENANHLVSKLFDLYFAGIQRACGHRLLSFGEQLDLHIALLQLQTRIDGKRLDRVDEIFGSIADLLSAETTKLNERDEAKIGDLLRAPLDQRADVLGIVQHSRFPELLSVLGKESKHAVALKLARSVTIGAERIEDAALCNNLFDLLGPLIEGSQDFEDEDHCDSLLQKIVFRIHHDDPNELATLLQLVKSRFQKCVSLRRRSRLYTPVCFCLMEIVSRRQLQDSRAPLQQVHAMCTQLGEEAEELPAVRENALRILFNCALTANRIKEEMICYECIVQAFATYETLADSKLQASLAPFMIGAVQMLDCLGKENMDVIQARTALYAAQLLKKADQARNVALSAHLFWSQSPERQLREGETPPIPGRNSKRALECLQRALKTVDIMQQNAGAAAPAGGKSQIVSLFVEVLNHYINMYQTGADKIKASYLTELVALISESIQGDAVDASVEAFYRKTMAHFKRLAAKGGRFAEFAASLGVEAQSIGNESDPENDPAL